MTNRLQGVFAGDWYGMGKEALSDVLSDIPAGLDGYDVVAAYKGGGSSYPEQRAWFGVIFSRGGRLYLQCGYIDGRTRVPFSPSHVSVRRFASDLNRHKYPFAASYVFANGLNQALFRKDIVE